MNDVASVSSLSAFIGPLRIWWWRVTTDLFPFFCFLEYEFFLLTV